MLVATAVAPLTSRIGLVPASGRADLAAGLAALDRASGGRGRLARHRRTAPRLPGHPLVTTLAGPDLPVDVAARGCDVVFVTPRPRRGRRPGRTGAARGPGVTVFADVVVFLGGPSRRTASTTLDGEGVRRRRPRLLGLGGRAVPICCSTGGRPGSTASGCARRAPARPAGDHPPPGAALRARGRSGQATRPATCATGSRAKRFARVS